MTDETKDALTPRAWVCTGKVTLMGGKKGIGLRAVVGDSELGDSAYFERKKFNGAAGSVYMIPTSEDGARLRLASAQWVRAWANTDDALMWKVQEDALLLSEAQAAKNKSGPRAAEDRMMQALEPIRIAYATARTHAERQRIELVALSYIRRP